MLIVEDSSFEGLTNKIVCPGTGGWDLERLKSIVDNHLEETLKYFACLLSLRV